MELDFFLVVIFVRGGEHYWTANTIMPYNMLCVGLPQAQTSFAHKVCISCLRFRYVYVYVFDCAIVVFDEGGVWLEKIVNCVMFVVFDCFLLL